MKIYKVLRQMEVTLAKTYKTNTIDKGFYDSLSARLLAFRQELDQATSDAKDQLRKIRS